MSGEVRSDSHLEIAHVLFIDIVGYSKRRIDEQKELVTRLNQLVRGSAQFQAADAAGKLIRIPTGDGMALAFFTSPDAPVNCAIELAKADEADRKIELRMGIHSGPVDRLSDVNDRTNLAGTGINMAQRVMDVGDAGHILLSQRMADDLAQYGRWQPFLHNLGEAELKHGVRIGIVSLYNGSFGNAAIPAKLQRARAQRRRRLLAASLAIAALLIVSAAGYLTYRHHVAARERAATEAAAQRERSVAVLPFESVTTNEQDVTFTGGVHREVLSNLAKVADLKVISRTSVMRYKAGGDRNIRQIANDLGVNYVVEATVQRDASNVHVTVELIDARTDTEAWSQTYDGRIADVLAFQSEIAQRISNQLGAKLSPRESNELATRPTKDIHAFESYVRAKALVESVFDENEPGEHEAFIQAQHQAIELLEQALARDPNFLLVHCGIAEANIQLFRSEQPYGRAQNRAAAENAIKNAERLGPEAGETLYTKSHYIYYINNDFHGALTMLERAAKVLPNEADITMTRGLLYRRFGRWQEAYAQFMRTAELKPTDAQPHILMEFCASGLRWWDEADRVRARAIAKFPRLAGQMKPMLMVTLRLRGEVEAGNKLMDEMHLTVKDGFAPLFYRALWKRDYAECRRLVDEAAKFPEIESDRWQKEARLAYVTKDFRSRSDALLAERKLEAKLNAAQDDETTSDLTAALVAVKYIAGKPEEALRLAEESLAKHPYSEDALSNIGRIELLVYACIYAGDHERAIQRLANAVAVPSVSFGYGRMKYDPMFDSLRSDPRFAQILEQSRQPFPRL